MREQVTMINDRPQIPLYDSIINRAIQEYLKKGYGVDIAKAVRSLEEDSIEMLFDNELVALEWCMENLHEYGYVRPAMDDMPVPYVDMVY